MVGRRIRITLKDDPLYGMEAVITGPRGKSKKPMYWWFRTTTGIEAYKANSSFKLLPVDDSTDTKAPSATKQFGHRSWQTELGCQESSCLLWQPRHVPTVTNGALQDHHRSST